VSAMTGAVNFQCLETTRTRLQALCPLTQKAAWRGAAGLCSSATQPPVTPSGRGRKPNDQRRGRASGHGHLLRPIESWSKSFAPYIHHTAKYCLKQLRVFGKYKPRHPNSANWNARTVDDLLAIRPASAATETALRGYSKMLSIGKGAA
jgi:hypothetical protein